ncbi:exopolysaccharide biosynthesis protein [Rhizobium sp. FKL33]|jgi:hypothetical protein|uniref:exopolysaccharide biosynthesis protein n=1 Tax=Rhizobium sp. FKL33 TaxID=2562307 RepID=UPI0010C10892|nr:exopolysaccharide biosynthesis protein [Rhizobium sp. FKL33]
MDDTTEQQQPRRGVATETLERLVARAAAAPDGSLSLHEVVGAMGRTSIAFTILILSLPPLCPIPGPFGVVFGTVLALVSLQIMAGARHIWLPGFLGRRRISAGVLDVTFRYTAPIMARVERLLKRDRMKGLTGRGVQRMLGLPVFLLAVAVALPIPFGNFLPVLALMVIATALIQRDGLAVIGGLAMTLVALGATAALVYGAAEATLYVFG